MPSNGPAAAARNSCGTTMRRLASSCFSNVEMNTPASDPLGATAPSPGASAWNAEIAAIPSMMG